MNWVVELLDDRVREELEALPVDMRARFRRIVELIQAHGLEPVGEPHTKHLNGPLWEMRMKGKDGISRAIRHCERAPGRCGTGIHQEQKTPGSEIDLALKRAEEVKDR